MSKRLNIYTYGSDDVQGEGSFVKVRSITWGASKRLTLEFDRADMEGKFALADEQVVQRVVEWNWVDDDGNPLPLPRDNPAVVDQLTEGERKFFIEVFEGERERKN